MDSRFLHIQIYDEDGIEVEYDNLIDDTWGIQASSASLSSKIMDNGLHFGDMYASMFQVTLFGIEADIRGRRIVVGINYNTGYNCIMDGNDRRLEDGNGNYIIYKQMSDVSDVIFSGNIESAKKDRNGYDRAVVAYDDFYVLRDINVAEFWNEFWATAEEREVTVTLAGLRGALLSYVQLTAVSGTFINDNIVIKNYFEKDLTQLRFQDLLSMICILQNSCPHLNPDNTIEFITLQEKALHDIRRKIEGQNSNWEDFTTEQITGVSFYNSDAELSQIIGDETNLYPVVGNILVSGMTLQEMTTVANNMLAELETITFVPGKFKMILSRPDWKLGDKVYTEYGLAYIFDVRFSGSVLIDETITCKQTDAYLSKDIKSYNDANGFKLEYADFKKNVSTQIEQTESQIVLKLDSNGNIAKVELSTDADEGEIPVLNLQANKVNITSDTIQFDNSGYIVKGDIYTTAITPDNYNITLNLNEFPQEEFPTIDINSIKNAVNYEMGYVASSTPTDGNYMFSWAFSVLSRNYLYKLSNNTVGTSKIYIITGAHSIITPAGWEQFINDEGYVDNDGFLVFPSGKTMYNYVDGDIEGMLSYVQSAFAPPSDPYTTMSSPMIVRVKAEDFGNGSYVGTGMPVVVAPMITMALNTEIYRWYNPVNTERVQWV